MGVETNLRISEAKGLLPPSAFPRCSSQPAEKVGKGRKRPISVPMSRKGSQTPLKPPFVTPPFAAAQLLLQNKMSGNLFCNRHHSRDRGVSKTVQLNPCQSPLTQK